MTISIPDPDIWPRIVGKIFDERARRMGDLLHIQTLEGMRLEQGFVQALDWVMDQANPPKPVITEEEEE